MRIRIAMSMPDRRVQRSRSRRTLRLTPVVAALDTAWTFITGKADLWRRSLDRIMIHDSATGKLLAAGADRRVGGDQIGRATFTTWGDVKNIVSLWSEFAATDCASIVAAAIV